MRRLCLEGKAHEGCPVNSEGRTVNPLDSATSTRIQSLVWASTSPQWKVTASLAVAGPRFQLRDTKSSLLHLIAVQERKVGFQ